MVIAIYLCIILASVTQSATTKLFHRHSSSSVVFNAVKAVTAFGLFTFLSVFGFSFHWQTVLFGICYGVCLCLSMYSGYRALCLGPMALTSMLVSFSVLLPLLWGLLVRRESLNVWQIFALFGLFLSLVLLNADKLRMRTDEKQQHYGRWLMFVGLTFVTNGLCSILQAEHQARYPGAYNREFMVFAMLICSAVFVTLLRSRIHFHEIRLADGKRYGVLSGLANGIAGMLTLKMAGMEQATILFPLLSLGTLLGSLLCGKFFFGERLKMNHYIAFAVGTVAVLLLKLPA